MKRLLTLLQVAMGIVPKKLYTMKVDTQVDGVKMINGHLALFGPYYIGIVDNVKLKYMAPKLGFHLLKIFDWIRPVQSGWISLDYVKFLPVLSG